MTSFVFNKLAKKKRELNILLSFRKKRKEATLKERSNKYETEKLK